LSFSGDVWSFSLNIKMEYVNKIILERKRIEKNGKMFLDVLRFDGRGWFVCEEGGGR
jgi:hypothetical protein